MLVYGDLVSAQLENLASAPTAVSGRVYFNTTSDKPEIHDGDAWVDLAKYTWKLEEAWSGAETTKTYTVDGTVTPSRGKVLDSQTAVWQFKDASNDYLVMDAAITCTSATSVTVTFDAAIPAGNYLLVGVQ